MKRGFFKLLFTLFLSFFILAIIALGLFIYKAKYGINFYETTPPELPANLGSKNVLVFSKTNGFRHGEAIAASIPIFERMAEDEAWSIFVTDNGAVFNKDQLSKFQVVIWNNTSGKVLNESQRTDFKNYIEQGGGFIGIHAAGDDSHQWEWYTSRVIGALFSHHPIDPQIQLGTLRLEQGDSIITEDLLPVWSHADEWYTFFDNPRSRGGRVLYTLDETGLVMSGNLSFLIKNKDFGMGEDHPIVWYKELEKGRVFYSAIGHNAAAFSDVENIKMLKNAIIWAGRF